MTISLSLVLKNIHLFQWAVQLFMTLLDVTTMTTIKSKWLKTLNVRSGESV